jgi:hypothetical protein
MWPDHNLCPQHAGKVQAFDVTSTKWSRYLLLHMRNHHGTEPACTVNALRVFGTTEAEDLEEQLTAIDGGAVLHDPAVTAPLAVDTHRERSLLPLGRGVQTDRSPADSGVGTVHNSSGAVVSGHVEAALQPPAASGEGLSPRRVERGGELAEDAEFIPALDRAGRSSGTDSSMSNVGESATTVTGDEDVEKQQQRQVRLPSWCTTWR